MANETIGTCECFICGIDAQVRRNRKGKLYLYCPDCGMIQPNLKGAQAHIEKRMRPISAEKSEPPPSEKPALEPAIERAREPAFEQASDPEPEPVKDDLDAMWD